MESLDQFRRLEVCEKARNVFEMSLPMSDLKVLHIISSLSSFFDFARILRSYFVLPNFWSLRNLIKQLFHSRLLDMRLVIANEALRASLAIYHLISNARSWNNCGRHVGFAITMKISYTFLRGQKTQVREVIRNILATQMIYFTFIECLSPK